MKSMKTIIRLLTTILITTISLSTVVACSKPRTLQNDVDYIIIALESGIQGKDLTSGSSSQENALSLFQAAAIYINKDATVALAILSDAIKPLVKGDSIIKVIVTIKTITSLAFEANIIGVK